MKLDSIEEQQRKRFERFLSVSDEMLEMAAQLEHDCNYFGDYIENHKLLHASKHAGAIYNIIKEIVDGDNKQ